jgi:hypothetical protein
MRTTGSPFDLIASAAFADRQIKGAAGAEKREF